MKTRITTKEIKQYLSQMPAPKMRSEVTQNHRKQALVAFESVTHTNEQRYNRQENIIFELLTQRLMLPIFIALALILGGTGTALASDGAVPGDMLYRIDRALEQTQLNFTFNDRGKAERYLAIANEREREMQQLLSENDTSNANLARTYEQQALEQAQSAIARALTERAGDNTGKSAETLTEVRKNLEELQNRFEERERERLRNELEAEFGQVELEAEIEGDRTRIQLNINGEQMNYNLDSTSPDTIYDSIQQRTGIGVDNVKGLIELKNANEKTDTEPQTESNEPEANEESQANDDNGNDSASQNRNTNQEQEREQERLQNQAQNQNANQSMENQNENADSDTD